MVVVVIVEQCRPEKMNFKSVAILARKMERGTITANKSLGADERVLLPTILTTLVYMFGGKIGTPELV